MFFTLVRSHLFPWNGKKNITRKRKRHFKGNEFAKSILNNGVENGTENTAEYPHQLDSENRILDLETLYNVFSIISFPECFNLKLKLNEKSRYKLCSHCTLKNTKRLQTFYKDFASSILNK